MTIKQKRAQALRKVSREEAAAGYSSGGFVDSTFPEADVRAALGPLIREIDWPEFSEFLGDRLGFFRAISEPLPPTHAERALAEELLEAVNQLRTRLKNLPPRLEANLHLHCHKRHASLFNAFRDRLVANLDETWNLVALAERDLTDGEEGRPRLLARDRLLHAVARYLEDSTSARKEQAATTAGDVIRACHLPAPTDAKDLRRIVRTIEAGGGKAL